LTIYSDRLLVYSKEELETDRILYVEMSDYRRARVKKINTPLDF
jgi:hypothetical protein